MDRSIVLSSVRMDNI